MWARLLNTGLGLWLMAAPAVLGYGTPASTNDRIVGPVIASLAIISIAEVTRSLRRINTVAGAWLLLSPWILGYETLPMLQSLGRSAGHRPFPGPGGGEGALRRGVEDAVEG